MSDIPAPPPGYELETPGVSRAAQSEPTTAAAPAIPAPPPGYEIEKAPAETFQRGTVLPFEKSDTTGKVRLAMPQIGKDLIDAISLPGRAAKGEDVTMDELINAAGFVTPGVAGVRGSKVLKDVQAGPSIPFKQFGTSDAVPKPVARAIRSDGLLPEQVAPKVAELGPEGVLADAGPNLQSLAGAVATTPGAGQKTVVDAMTARRAGAPERLRTELDTTLGPAPVPSEVDAGLKAGQKALSPEYTAALKGRPGDKDATLTWFLDGDKAVYANAAGSAERAPQTGLMTPERAETLKQHPSLTSTDGKVQVWYKPGAEDQARAALKANELPWGAPAQDWRKHYEQGVAYGYGEDKSRAFANQRVPEAPQAASAAPGVDASPIPEQFRRGGAVEGAKPVDTAALAKSLDEAIPTLRGDAQTAVTSVRKMLNKTGGAPVTDPATIISAEMDPAKRRELVRKHLAGEPLDVATPLDTDPATLLETRRAIGGMLDTTKDGNTRRVLTQAKQSVDDMLAASVPGIKEIDAKHGSLAQAKTNLDVGQTALDSGRESLRPSEMRAKMAEANTPVGTEMGPTVQAQALTQGARAEIDRIVGTNLNDRAALNSLVKGEGDWNYDRLSTLFGKEKTDRIYKVLENERTMAQTENLATAGSKTGAITAAQKEVSPAAGGPGVVQSALDLKPGSALTRLKDRLLGRITEQRQANQNSSIADIIMGNGPLKANVVGKTRGVGPVAAETLNQVIMRPDVNPAPTAADREKLRRFQADKVY